MKNQKYRVVIISIIAISIIANIFLYMENKNLKENKGDEINSLSDIVLVLIPRDILEVLKQEENISDVDFERIKGEFRVGIVSYWLSRGIPEIESYLRYMEIQFLNFEKLYQESEEKDSEEIKKARKELIDTCEIGLKLYDELDNYLNKGFDEGKILRGYEKNKNSRIWYSALKNKNNSIRKLIIETLGEERIKY